MKANDEDPLLSGAFAPLSCEYDCADLRVEGDLPRALDGVLYRVGPNPQFPPLGPYNPLQGDGMIHAFRISEGRVSYRNRWVRTVQWRLEREAGRSLFATADPRLNDPAVAGVPSQGAANTHIVRHAGRLLALEEGHPPIAIEAETLATLGVYDFDGGLPGAMTAHPKIDPRSGEMLFFANFPTRQFDGAIALYVADGAGRIVRSAAVVGPYPALVHDFAVTERHIILVVCPLTLSLERLRAGGPPIAWEPHRSAFVGVLPRAGSLQSVDWRPVPASMVWHTVNAYDQDEDVVLDVCQQAAPAFPDASGQPAPEPALRQYLTRWEIPLRAGGEVRCQRLSEVVCEYPRIDERRLGLPHRYVFVATNGGPGTGDLLHRAIGRFDVRHGEMCAWAAAPGQAVSEPVFVPRALDGPEGAGYLLVTVFDACRNASHLAVFDAEDLRAGPIARAFLDHRVPAGFHGSFVPSV